MAKKSVADVAKEVYQLLEPLKDEERKRVIGAVLALFGQSEVEPPPTGGDINKSPQQYFDKKDPCTKIEILAVAARLRELGNKGHQHQKGDFRSILKDARRSFDEHNFSTDIQNAKLKGLFIKGKDHHLSSYGQQYVDALPDREKVKNLRAPTKKRGKKAKKKKAKAKIKKK